MYLYVDQCTERYSLGAGVEAAGFGIDTDKHAATLTMGSPGVLHGSMSYLIQDADGQIIDPHSISAGLDYPGMQHLRLPNVMARSPRK